MTSIQKRLMRGVSAGAVWAYRRSGGRIGGKAAGGTPVLLLTVAGRTTGTPRTTPVSYFEHDGAYVVAGSAGGSPHEPQWMRNLRAAGTAHVEVGAEHHDVTVHVADEAEHAALWGPVVVARAPAFGAYERKAGRPIPLAVLTPIA